MATTTPEQPPRHTLQYLDPNTILPHSKNPRHRLGDLRDLTASVKEQGVMEPLVVEPVPPADIKGAKAWLLINGHRRLAAAKSAGLDTVPAMVAPEASDQAEQIARMLVENLQRADLTAVEEGDAYQDLLDLGTSAATIARRVSRPKKTVTDLVKVAGLPESARHRISEGQLTLEDAAKMTAFAKDPAVLESLEKAATESKWHFDEALARAEHERATDREVTKKTKELRAAGVTVLTEAELDDRDDDRAQIDEVLDPDSVPNDDDYGQKWHEALADTHRDCPGHAATVQPQPWRSAGSRAAAVYWCLQPALHDDQDAAAEINEQLQQLTAEQKQERAAERARLDQQQREREERRLQLASTGVARRHYLAEVLTAPEADNVAMTVLLRRFDNIVAGKVGWRQGQQRMLAEVVLPNATQDSLDKPDLADRLRKGLQRLTVTQLALLATIADNLQKEDALSTRDDDHTWSGDTEWTSGWRRDLTEVWGYQWSDFEQQLMAGDHADGEDLA